MFVKLNSLYKPGSHRVPARLTAAANAKLTYFHTETTVIDFIHNFRIGYAQK